MTQAPVATPQAAPRGHDAVVSRDRPFGRFLLQMIAQRHVEADIEYGRVELRQRGDSLPEHAPTNLSQAQMAAEVLDETEAFLKGLSGDPWYAEARVHLIDKAGHPVEFRFNVSAFRTDPQVARERLTRLGLGEVQNSTELTHVRLAVGSRRFLG